MNLRTEIQGREFDWFASDSAGAIAIFATAGEGFVPDSAIVSGRRIEQIVNSIPTPNWGSDAVWDDYSQTGLVVFDWKLPGGPYRCVRRPKVALAHELKRELLSIIDMPQYDGLFSDIDEIAEWSARAAT